MVREFQRKRPYRILLSSPFLSVILIGLTLFLVARAVDIRNKMKSTDTTLEVSSQESMSLEQRKEFLESEIERLSTDRGMEEEIRTKFGVAAAGEELAILVDPSSGENDEVLYEKRSLWQKFLDIFR
jgi:cell division protein FtsB